MSFDQIERDISNQLICANEHVCILQEKLLCYNNDIDKRTDLQIRLGNQQQCMEDLENKLQQTNADQKCMIDAQTRKLKKIEEEEAVLRSTNNRFIDVNERMSRQICALKEKEQTLLCEIKRAEDGKQVLENQLCYAKETVDELNAMVDKQKKCLRSKEDEMRCVLGQTEQRCAEHQRLVATCCQLDSELERALSKISEARSQAARAEEQLACEKHELCCELEAKRSALRAVTEQLSEAKLTADRERARTDQLDRSAAEQRRANEQDKRAAEAQAQRLNKENRGKEVSVCRMKEQIAELRRDAERTAADTHAVQEQVRAHECLLETAKRAAVADAPPAGRSRYGSDREHQLERDTDALACDVRRKTKKIAELERQVCCLRGELGAAAKVDCCACGRPPPPPPPPPPAPPAPAPHCPLPTPPRCTPSSPAAAAAPPTPPCCPKPKPSCCPLPAESCSSIGLSTAFSANSCCAPKSTCSGGDDGGGGCASENDIFFNELKQLYCDMENIQKSNN